MLKKNRSNSPIESKEGKLAVVIMKSNENWFSFFSGVIANIPITLLLTIDKTPQHNSLYWIIYAMTIVMAIFAMIFAILITVRKIDIKDKVKDLYDTYVMTNGKIAVPKMYNQLLKTEYQKNKKFLKTIVILFFLSVALLLGLIVALWWLK